MPNTYTLYQIAKQKLLLSFLTKRHISTYASVKKLAVKLGAVLDPETKTYTLSEEKINEWNEKVKMLL